MLFRSLCWALSNPTIVEHISISAEPSARQWLFSMMHTMEQEDFTRMVITMWALWHARRKVIHEEIFQSPMATHNFVDSFLRDMGMCKTVKVAPPGLRRCPPVPRWIAPPTDSCKVNTDGAVAKTANRGCSCSSLPIC